MIVAIACERSTLLVLVVSSPKPPLILKTLLLNLNIVAWASIGSGGVAKKIGIMASAAILRNPRIAVDNICNITCPENAGGNWLIGSSGFSLSLDEI